MRHPLQSTRRRPRRLIEPLEARLVLSANGMPGNDNPPDLDLSSIGVQTVEPLETITLDLLAAGGAVIDRDGSGGPTDDVIRFQLDPDVPFDTPLGATISSDGVFEWTPTANQLGTFEIVVIAIDCGQPALADAEVLTIVVNRAPIATDNQYTADETTALVSGNILTDDTGDGVDSDPDGNSLAVITIDPTSALGVTLDLNGNGQFTYDPSASAVFDALATGEMVDDTFNYTISDGLGGTDSATVTITITGVNDAPTVEAGQMFSVAATATPDTEVGTVLADDVDSDNLTFAITGGNPGASPNQLFAIDSSSGQITVNNPALLMNNDQHTLTIEVTDDGAGTLMGSGTVEVNVTGSPPIATDNVYTTGEETPQLGGNVITDDTGAGVDSDPDDDLLTVVGFNAQSNLGAAVNVNNDGSFNYIPTSSQALDRLAEGEVRADTFTYTISDGNGGTDTATVTINVTGVNDEPTAGNDTAEIGEDGPSILIDVLDNDTDPDIDGAAPDDGLMITNFSQVTENVLVSVENGQVRYDPNGVFNNLALEQQLTDTFTYTISDGNGGTDSATVTVTITGLNDPPNAEDDTATVNEDGPVLEIDVLGNDTDPDVVDPENPGGGGLVVVELEIIDLISGTGQVTVGAAMDDDDEEIILYDPNGAFDHLAEGQTTTDVFDYTVSDGAGGTDSASVMVTVIGQNDAPNLVPIAAQQAVEGTLLEVPVTGGDIDEGTVLTFSLDLDNSPEDATIETTGPNTAIVRWTPGPEDVPGPVGFRVLVTDNASVPASDAESFEVTVQESISPPVVDLNGTAAGNDFEATFTAAGAEPILIVNSDDLFGLTVATGDNPQLIGATATLNVTPDGSNETLAVETTGTGITASYSTTTGVLTLTGNDTPAAYQQVLRTLTYHNTATTPQSGARNVAVVVDDGAVTSDPATATVHVAFAPMVDLNGSDTGFDFATTFSASGGPVLLADPTATITDVDSNTLESLSVTLLSPSDEVMETLAATTTGTEIVSSFDEPTGVLTLAGNDTLANYQQVLRSVTYDDDTTSDTITLSADNVIVGPDEVANVPIRVNHAGAVQGIDLVISFDPSQFLVTANDIQTTSMTDAWNFVFVNLETPGQIQLTMAGTRALGAVEVTANDGLTSSRPRDTTIAGAGSGAILNIRFQPQPGATVGSSLTFSGVRFNEGQIVPEVTNGSITINGGVLQAAELTSGSENPPANLLMNVEPAVVETSTPANVSEPLQQFATSLFVTAEEPIGPSPQVADHVLNSLALESEPDEDSLDDLLDEISADVHEALSS